MYAVIETGGKQYAVSKKFELRSWPVRLAIRFNLKRSSPYPTTRAS